MLFRSNSTYVLFLPLTNCWLTTYHSIMYGTLTNLNLCYWAFQHIPHSSIPMECSTQRRFNKGHFVAFRPSPCCPELDIVPSICPGAMSRACYHWFHNKQLEIGLTCRSAVSRFFAEAFVQEQRPAALVDEALAFANSRCWHISWAPTATFSWPCWLTNWSCGTTLLICIHLVHTPTWIDSWSFTSCFHLQCEATSGCIVWSESS